jgi:hypothetical protein
MIWLLVSYFGSEYATRLVTIARIEKKLDQLISRANPVELIEDPNAIWEKASVLLHSSNMAIIETTSLRNSPEYEAALREAAARGTTVTRYVCATPDTQLRTLVDLPPQRSELAKCLRHIPAALPLDCLIAGPQEAPKVIIGLRPPGGGARYESGLQINDPATALRFKPLLERELDRLATDHYTHRQGCALCAELDALK